MFNPTLDSQLTIDGEVFTFTPHPAVPSIVWGQEGRHAIVYQIRSANRQRTNGNGSTYALKVFRPVFRHPGLIEAADALWMYHELPGMSVCKQTVILQETHPELVTRHEDLDYAMVMPWMQGKTWFDFLSAREPLTLDQSRALAESMAWTLYALELNNLAHCDLSSGNIIIDPTLDNVHLIDVEDLYSPWLEPPPYIPAGSIGYQHKAIAQKGQWGPLGDRFSGAVLIAEMLGWAHPDVRDRAWGESYFAPEELQKDNERLELLVEVLDAYDPGFSEAFQQAWRSRKLESCPPLETWYSILDELPREPVAEWVAIDPKVFEVKPPKESLVASSLRDSQELTAARNQSIARRVWDSGCRKGCRQLTVLGLVLALFACYAAFLAVEWMMLNDVF